jgi:hypothetical protein
MLRWKAAWGSERNFDFCYDSGLKIQLYINGEIANISLAQRVAKSKEIIERENIPPSKYFDTQIIREKNSARRKPAGD